MSVSASAGVITAVADDSVVAGVTVALPVLTSTDAVYDVVADANSGLIVTLPSDSELNDGSLSSAPTVSEYSATLAKVLLNDTCSRYREPVTRPVSESRSTLPAFCRCFAGGHACPNRLKRQYIVEPSVLAIRTTASAEVALTTLNETVRTTLAPLFWLSRIGAVFSVSCDSPP